MFKNPSISNGLSFGLTSGVITTLGLLVGLEAGSGSRQVILAGILTIAIADALSDALGIHMVEESNKNQGAKKIWQTTITTLLTKFIFALSFAVPVIIFPIGTALVVSVVWGLFLIAGLSYFISRFQGETPWKSIAEHLIFAILVIVIAHYIGQWAANLTN